MRKRLNLFMVIILSLLLSGCVISGTITDESGTGIEGVEVMITGSEGQMTISTDVDGNYSFINLLPGNYTITPSSDGHTFTPATVNANKATTTVDFEGELLGRFTDMGNGTVRDNDTGLIWLKNANAFSPANWDDAMTAAATLDEGDFAWLTDGSSEGDWRLPTKEEYELFVDNTYTNPALSNAAGDGKWSEGDAFTNVQSDYYWSSTEGVASTAYTVYLGVGYVYDDYYSTVYELFMWPVRSDN